jgi:hypothetical protein
MLTGKKEGGWVCSVTCSVTGFGRWDTRRKNIGRKEYGKENLM